VVGQPQRYGVRCGYRMNLRMAKAGSQTTVNEG
jgi:hypothetical protein